MRKPVIRDLDQEKDTARPNLLQIIYALHTILYFQFCKGRFDSFFPMKDGPAVFYGLTFLEVLLLIVTLVYNYRYEERPANRYMCYAFIFLAAAGFYVYLF